MGGGGREKSLLFSENTEMYNNWQKLSDLVFTKAKEIEMMEEGYVWIITHGLTDLIGSLNSSAIDSMQGVWESGPTYQKLYRVDKF